MSGRRGRVYLTLRVRRGTLSAMLRDCRRQIVIAILDEEDGDVPRTGVRLGVARTNVYKLLRRCGIRLVRRVHVQES